MVGSPTAFVVALALVTGVTATGVTWSPSMASAGVDGADPLEIVAVDVTAFPTVVIDVALPVRELPAAVSPGAFSVEGARSVQAQLLDPSDLTVSLVIDDGVEVSPEAMSAQQGATVELIRNLPDGIDLTISSTRGVVSAPTSDRAANLAAVSQLGTLPEQGAVTLARAVVGAAERLESATDPRRQLVVLADEGADLTEDERTLLGTSLDRSGAALRFLGAGDVVGPNVVSAAAASGGVAVGIGRGADSVLRALDVLTTTLAEQYRLTMTVDHSGSRLVRLNVADRAYEAAVPIEAPSPPTTAAPPATAAPTTSRASAAPTAPAASSPTTVVPVTTPSGAVTPTPVPNIAGDGRARGAAPSILAGVEAVFAVAALALVFAVIRRRVRERPRDRRPVAPGRRQTAGGRRRR